MLASVFSQPLWLDKRNHSYVIYCQRAFNAFQVMHLHKSKTTLGWFGLKCRCSKSGKSLFISWFVSWKSFPIKKCQRSLILNVFVWVFKEFPITILLQFHGKEIGKVLIYKTYTNIEAIEIQ